MGALGGLGRRRGALAMLALACGLLLVALSPGRALAAPSFDAHGSVEQVYATGLNAGARVSLYNSGGGVVETKNADNLGGILFRNVTPGGGYRVGLAGGGTKSGPLQVLTQRSAPPNPNLYNQSIPSSGYGYLTTRDGTKLSIYVHPPQDVSKVATGAATAHSSAAAPSSAVSPAIEVPKLPIELPKLPIELPKLPELPGTGGGGVPELPTVPTGPTPTLIEYSGYGYANPAGPENGISLIANLMGFTVVDVNMRGTGCSGGAYDFFEPLQNLDGYDVVEAIAHQPWEIGRAHV